MRRWLSALRLRMARGRILRVTPVGRIYLLLTVGIGLGALNTGNNLLYLVLGLLLATIVVSGVLSERVIWDLTVRRILPEGAFAHEPFALRYEIQRRRGRAFALRVRELGGVDSEGAWAPVVAAGHPVIVRCTARAPRRGPWALQLIEISTTFPFGIFEKIRVLSVPDRLLVYPRRGFACAPPATVHAPQLGDQAAARWRDGTADVADVRELRPGEDARRISWKKSAAAGKLIAVDREREERRRVTLTLQGGLDLDELDRACEEAAVQTSMLMSQGYDVGLATGDSVLRPGHGPVHERRVLSALALVGYGDAP